MSLAMTATCKALQQVLQLQLPGNLAADNRQLRAENARLQAEVQQLRDAAMSPYGNNVHTQDPRHRLLTWREFGTERNEMTMEMSEKMDKADNILRAAREEISRLTGTPAYTPQLEQAHNAMCDAEQALAEQSDEEQSDEEEDEEEEEQPRGAEAAVVGQRRIWRQTWSSTFNKLIS